MTRIKHQLLVAGCLFFIASQGIASENSKAVADESFNGTMLVFEYKGNFSNATISVSGPDGFTTSHFQKQGSPSLNLSETNILADGLYNYQLSVASDKTIKVTNNQDNGRGPNAKTTMSVGESQSGQFRVKDGAIMANSDISESQGGSAQ